MLVSTLKRIDGTDRERGFKRNVFGTFSDADNHWKHLMHFLGVT